MIDTFHEHQLPVRPLGMGLVLEGSAQLLDGYISVQNSIIARTADRHGEREGVSEKKKVLRPVKQFPLMFIAG